MNEDSSNHRINDMMDLLDSEIDSARDLNELYARVCDLVVGVGSYCMAWVGLAESNEEQTVRPMAHSGFNSGYIESIKISWSNHANGKGPTGRAIRTGEVQIVNDVSTDLGMRPWRELALAGGYNSCISLPLKDNVSIFGAIVVLACEKQKFNDI